MLVIAVEKLRAKVTNEFCLHQQNQLIAKLTTFPNLLDKTNFIYRHNLLQNQSTQNNNSVLCIICQMARDDM